MRCSAAARALRSLAMSARAMPSAAPAAIGHCSYPRAVTIRSKLPIRRLSFSTSTSTSTSSAPSSPPSTSEDLSSWLESRGGSAPPDRVAVFAEGACKGLALRCVSGAKAGEVLIRLPSSCMLDGDDDGAAPSPSPSSPLLPADVEAAVSRLCSRVPSELWGARLALRLLAHRAAGESSPLAPYLRALPAGVPGVPIFYPKEAIDVLQEYAPVGAQVLKRCRFLASFVKLEGLDGGGEPGSSTDAALAFSGASVDASALGWAFSIATSRAFRVRGDGRSPSLLPLIDMANHDFAPTAKVVPWREGGGSGGGSGRSNNDDSGVALVATADLDPGTPLTLNYGALPSDFFLLDYGFFAPYPGNPFDVVKLRWSQSLVDASAEFARVKMPSKPTSSLSSSAWKAAALAPLSLQSEPEVQVLTAHPWVDRRFLAAARVAAAESQADVRGRSLSLSASPPSSSSPSASASFSFTSKSDPSLADLESGYLKDPEAETRALRLLGGACLLSLASFPTTPEQDRAVLSLSPGEEGALTERGRDCREEVYSFEKRDPGEGGEGNGGEGEGRGGQGERRERGRRRRRRWREEQQRLRWEEEMKNIETKKRTNYDKQVVSLSLSRARALCAPRNRGAQNNK